MKYRDMTSDQKIDHNLRIAFRNLIIAGAFTLGSVTISVLIALHVPPPW